MANLQSQIDILGKAIVREHIKREDDKTEMVAINDKMLQSQYGGTTTEETNESGTKTITTLLLDENPHTQSHLSAALVNKNIKTGKTIDVGIYEDVNGELKESSISGNITGSSKIKFHIEDDDDHHVDGFMVINDTDTTTVLTIENKEYKVDESSTITKPLKFIGSKAKITADNNTSHNNKIYIIDSMGNIIANTSARTKDAFITTNNGDLYEIDEVKFDRELVGGMYRLADLNSNYRSGGGHEINFININIQKPGQGGEEVQG